MRPTCDFERFDPPVLNEQMLRRELEKRAERRRTVLRAIAGMLLQAMLVLFGLLWVETAPALALGCVCSAIVSVAGSGAIAIVYALKGGVNCDVPVL